MLFGARNSCAQGISVVDFTPFGVSFLRKVICGAASLRRFSSLFVFLDFTFFYFRSFFGWHSFTFYANLRSSHYRLLFFFPEFLRLPYSIHVSLSSHLHFQLRIFSLLILRRLLFFLIILTPFIQFSLRACIIAHS